MQPFYPILVKLLLAHILTDFVLQPRKWVDGRNQYHFSSKYLYAHTICTALVAWLMMGFQHWLIVLIIFVTHTLIDGWKSYMPKKVSYFLLDQALHVLVILACWYTTFGSADLLLASWQKVNSNPHIWYVVAGMVFLTTPCGIFIGEVTKQWRDKLPDSESLASAGKWIGILERILILVLVLNDKYEGFGLLVAAKSILRFNETDRPEIKTEYLLIGTLISASLAFFTGLAIKALG